MNRKPYNSFEWACNLVDMKSEMADTAIVANWNKSCSTEQKIQERKHTAAPGRSKEKDTMHC